jgi:tetratricopeptide (TPR) repeat protein
MKRSPRHRIAARPLAYALLVLAFVACYHSQAQTTPPAAAAASQPDVKKPAPAFKASGIQGNIAPSGYSAGAREEETRQVSGLISDLQAANLAGALAGDETLNCDRQPALLHAVLSEPRSFAANLRLGLFYLQHETPALSVKYLGAAAEIDPTDLAVDRYLATAEIAVGDYSAAGRLAGHLIDANRLDPEAHWIKGAVEAAAGNTNAALAEYKLAASLDPAANNILSVGLSLMALGSYADARQILTAGTAAHPGSAKLWLGRGMSEILNESRDPAIDSLLRSAALDPADLLAPTLLAAQANTAETAARVLPAVRSLAAASPAEPIAHYNYALVLSQTDPFAQDAHTNTLIQSELQKAIEEQPQFAAAHFQLGVFYQDTGNTQSAIAELSQAVHLAPQIGAWRYRLARAYRKAGQVASSEQQMQQFEQLRAQINSGTDASAKLLDGVIPAALGAGAALIPHRTCQPPSTSP